MIMLLRCAHPVQLDAITDAAGAKANLLHHGVADTLGLVGARRLQADTKVSWCRFVEWRMLK
jgi:hypothetical protein